MEKTLNPQEALDLEAIRIATIISYNILKSIQLKNNRKYFDDIHRVLDEISIITGTVVDELYQPNDSPAIIKKGVYV